jgi:hypothetical protein
MNFLTLQLKQNADTVLEGDIGLDELIPVVREISRVLERIPVLRSRLSGYRAYATPLAQLSDDPQMWLSAPPPADSAPLFSTLVFEHAAFYNQAAPELCLNCIDRARCPAVHPVAQPISWISTPGDFQPFSAPIAGFLIQLVDVHGADLYRNEFSTQRVFGKLIEIVQKRYVDQGAALPNATFKYEITCCQRDPRAHVLLSHASARRRPSATATVYVIEAVDRSAAQPLPELPESMVTWDEEDSSQTLSDSIRISPFILEPAPTGDVGDLDIAVLETEQTDRTLMRLDSSTFGMLQPVGARRDDDMPIFLRDKVLAYLQAYQQKRGARIGFLVGKPFIDLQTNKQSLLIDHQMVFADAATGLAVESIMNTESLRMAHEQLQKRFEPDTRLVGWYRLYSKHAQQFYDPQNPSVQYLLAGESSTLTADEVFMHQHFFPSSYQVVLVFDPVTRECRIFTWSHKSVRSVQGFTMIMAGK